MTRKQSTITLLRHGLSVVALLACAVTQPAMAEGAGVTPPGSPLIDAKHDYQRYCAVCHGPEGRGDGPVALAFKAMPADLTLLKMNNDGAYPVDRVRDIIDGRKDVVAHGSRVMPVWGEELRNSPEGVGLGQARNRINDLVEYLRTMQQ